MAARLLSLLILFTLAIPASFAQDPISDTKPNREASVADNLIGPSPNADAEPIKITKTKRNSVAPRLSVTNRYQQLRNKRLKFDFQEKPIAEIAQLIEQQLEFPVRGLSTGPTCHESGASVGHPYRVARAGVNSVIGRLSYP